MLYNLAVSFLIAFIGQQKVNMGTTKSKIHQSEFEPLERLLLAIRNDPVINKKVGSILILDAYRRCFVLNNWLEQLRQKQASEKLIEALSCLFDDTIASKVLTLIKNHQVRNT